MHHVRVEYILLEIPSQQSLVSVLNYIQLNHKAYHKVIIVV